MFVALAALHAALGLSCVGGVVWCAVRAAYPDAAAPPAHPPGEPGA